MIHFGCTTFLHAHLHTHKLNSFITRCELQKRTIQKEIQCNSDKVPECSFERKRKSGQTHLSLCFQVCHNYSHDIHYNQTEALKMTNEVHNGGLTKEIKTFKGEYTYTHSQIF